QHTRAAQQTRGEQEPAAGGQATRESKVHFKTPQVFPGLRSMRSGVGLRLPTRRSTAQHTLGPPRLGSTPPTGCQIAPTKQRSNEDLLLRLSSAVTDDLELLALVRLRAPLSGSPWPGRG